MSEEKVNVQVAAKALNVTTKTIHRWLASGTLTRIKEGGRTFISMDEVRALRQRQEETTKNDVSNFIGFSGQDKTIVPVERSHYEGLLTRLGQLETEKRYLLEYKANIEDKDKELSEARVTISKARNELQKMVEFKQEAENKGKALLDQQAIIEAKERENIELKAEVERLKRPWWWRIFK